MTDVNWSPGMSFETLEKNVLIRAMRHYGNNRELVAQVLGISRRTLAQRIVDFKKDGVIFHGDNYEEENVEKP